ncbi:hypothetical protein ABZR88_17895 [Mucilaginibacter yixingensis]|uniref:hypothetical protein n=1 Tax=Mucilaginibacter yixingensis TaxID=1295612 RepID=UPI001474DD3B|nr:hypothetical protein [Mucilaginibacter yixingensis]
MKRLLQNFSFCSPGQTKCQTPVQHFGRQIIGTDGHPSFSVDNVSTTGIKRIVTDI